MVASNPQEESSLNLKMSENPDSKPQEDGKKVDTKESSYIKLKVKAVDNTEMHFKLKTSTPFHKLITNYCNKMDVATSAYRFTFEGMRLDPNKTPLDYQMEDDDIIDVFSEQVGGH